MNRYYAGLSTTCHDSALALVGPDGRVLFAEATERYLQDKRAWNAAPDSLLRMESLLAEYVPADAQLVLARSWISPADPEAALSRPAHGALLEKMLTEPGFRTLKATATGIRTVNDLAGLSLGLQQLRRGGGSVISRTYDHHLTHAANGCLTSDFDEALCLVADGYGEDLAGMGLFRFRDGRPESLPLGDNHWLFSPGLLYGKFCEACGFDPLRGEEWKVMGLAAEGRLDPGLYDQLHPYLRFRDGVPETPEKFLPVIRILSRLESPADDQVRADRAFTFQHLFTEMMVEWLNGLHRKFPCQNLVLAGGCALNSATNGRILAQTPFTRLHVPCAPADDGNALGAALLAWQEDHAGRRPPVAASPWLGSRICREELGRLVRYSGLQVTELSETECCRQAAATLAGGGIIGWICGRAEFGPRALGNRSILGNPCDPGIKDRLNRTVKFRESFRPFAPAILHEAGPEYFEDYAESPYMERALVFRESVRARVPGVVHGDGTGRLQSVRESGNPPLWRLIVEFEKLTGVPLVLNTSYNVMGKPISHSVGDVLSQFLTSGMDRLFIENVMFDKPRKEMT